jgi:hypothetical protein
MSRIALAGALTATLTAALGVTLAASCSKSAGTQEGKTSSAAAAPDMVAPPGGPGPGAPGGDVKATGGPKGAAGGAFKLKPEEGELSIEVPADAAAGKETIARVVVTPTSKFKINFEYSTLLSLQPPEGVSIEKAEMKAGGMAKVQGDAEKFEEKKLAFAVKLTPKASGSHTINGTFKFAVCDKDTCLAKKETIAFQVAAK